MQIRSTTPPLLACALVRVLRADLRLRRYEDTWPKALLDVLRAARTDTLARYRAGHIGEVHASLDLRAFAARCEAEILTWTTSAANEENAA